MKCWLLAGLLVLGGVGCSEGCAGRPIVAIDLIPPDAPTLSMDVGAGTESLRGGAGRLPGFLLAEGRATPDGWQLTARVRLATERTDDKKPSKVRRALGLEAELTRIRRAGPEPQAFVAEAMTVEVVARDASATPQLLRTVDALLERLKSSIRLSNASPDALARAVADEDAYVRALAVKAVKDRKLSALEPDLVRRLNEDQVDLQEALQLVGALGAVGGPAAAEVLIDTTSRFHETTIPILFILARIGGREAQAFLFTVKSGHEDPRVRAAASDALAELEAIAEGQGL